jgi:hypothetical protein
VTARIISVVLIASVSNGAACRRFLVAKGRNRHFEILRPGPEGVPLGDARLDPSTIPAIVDDDETPGFARPRRTGRR